MLSLKRLNRSLRVKRHPKLKMEYLIHFARDVRVIKIVSVLSKFFCALSVIKLLRTSH